MTRPDAAATANILRELGQRMELEGGNPYRARAYRKAADNLALSPLPLDQLIAEGRLKEIPGIGDALAAAITKIHKTGKHAGLEAMREQLAHGGGLLFYWCPGTGDFVLYSRESERSSPARASLGRVLQCL